MNDILQILAQGLDRDIRVVLIRRVDAMMRSIRYEAEQHTHAFRVVADRGWNFDNLESICTLHVFHSAVLGPLAATGQQNGAFGLVQEHPIRFGEEICVDRAQATALRECCRAFTEVLAKLGVSSSVLTAPDAHQLLIELARPEATEVCGEADPANND